MQDNSTKENIKQIMRFLGSFRGIIILIVFFGIIVSIAESVGVTLVIPLLEGVGHTGNTPLPFPFNQVAARFLGMGLKERIQSVAILMVIIIGFKSLLTYAGSLLINQLHQSSIKYYRMLCFGQLMRLKMGYFNKQRLGHIQAIIVTSVNYVGALICACAEIVSKLFTIIFLLVMLFILSWKMTIVALVLVGVSSLVLRFLSHRSKIAGGACNITLQNINSTLLDALTGMKIIRLFNREKDMVTKFADDSQRYKESHYDLYKARDLAAPLFEFTGVFSLALVMIVGSFVLGGYGNASLEALLFFLFIFFRIMPLANSLNVTRVSIVGYWPFLTRVHEFLQEKDELYIANGARAFSGLKSGIEMREVDFKYNNNEALVLRGVSFFISKGLKVGIVGPSGGGKSTIIELLLRFYDPQNGKVLIDGVDLRDFDVSSWRRYIGVVSQDTFLFNDTVWANISFAKPAANKEEIEEAAQRAHAYDFIKELPEGYNTMLGERGVRLSGGQKQRIAIARAILSNPEILIFDEATSALDTESEQIVQEALDEVSKGKTVIIIAHRLSTISDADMIFVVAEGHIVQKANHKQLLEVEGIYKKLVQLQSLEAKHE